MAATEKKQMWLWSLPPGEEIQIRTLPIAASQGIFMPGAPCYISTSGTVKLCDTADGSDAWHGFIVGVEDKSTTWPLTAQLASGTHVKVAMINLNAIYAVYVETSGTDAASTEAMRGNNYGLVVSATAGQVGYTSLNTANSNGVVQAVDPIWVKDATKSSATSPGILLVKFLSTIVAATKA
jgi:hypothetical protein